MSDLPRPRGARKTSTFWGWTKSAQGRRLFTACRWIHVYISTVMFSLLLFFCVTGLLLNHLSWFDSKGAHRLERHELPAALRQAVRDTENPPLGRVERMIEEVTGLKNPRKVNLDVQLGEWTFDYPLPAGYAFITIFLEDGVMEAEFQEGTLVGVLNDLHKGRHTGAQWSWVIDLSAILIGLSALTGLVILLQQAKWRLSGLVLVVAGTVSPWLIYILWVPSAS
ncbi:PepSY-associated TM helix domain-containing protein [Sulfidibacter corallicola]|uniref:PepSY-associated TM helix domain-containing protein n=1 Tax=Sulfidibacter corallicola TaxID=2818388 RepID=A0A8A4TKW4_SULCO|nr:PepSY-associated TM helix domain-containing protein [Sulfidibacter corallicola]QTD50649.1 PepSY-associated TM helix domain-containing protein [Sulfidibacter corallicola]